MSDIPASGVLGDLDPGHLSDQFSGEIEDFRDTVCEMPGSVTHTTLTIASGAIVPPAGAGGGWHLVDTEGAAASDDLTSATLTNAHVGRRLTLAAVNAARVVTVKNAATGSGQFLTYDDEDFVLDALDKWIEFRLVATDWIEVRRSYGVDRVSARADLGVPQQLAVGILAPHERLRIDYATAATLTIVADAVVLTDTDGNQLRYASINETLTVSSTGAGGRDVTENAGAEKASDWYHLWLIGKADGTLDAFAALACFPGGSSIYSVLPAGYTHAGYIGAAYNNGSSNFADFFQRGEFAHCSYASLVSSGVQTSLTAVSMAAAVPDTARTALLNVAGTPASAGTTATVVVAPDSATATAQITLQWTPASAGTPQSFGTTEIALRASQLMGYRVSAGDSADIGVIGWRF